MRIESLIVEKGFFKNEYSFKEGLNFIYSEHNSRGKTSLVRFMLYGLGYPVTFTSGFQGSTCITTLTIVLEDSRKIVLNRPNRHSIDVHHDDVVDTFSLPSQHRELLAFIFGGHRNEILDNVLGCSYFDQEKGWTLFNRGKVIGTIRFDIEELVDGLSEANTASLKVEIDKIKKQNKFYKNMKDALDYSTTVINESARKVEARDSEESLTLVSLRMKKKQLISSRSQVNSALKNNEQFSKYVSDMKLTIELPDGGTVLVTKDNIYGFSDTEDLLKAKKEYFNAEINSLSKQIDLLEKDVPDNPQLLIENQDDFLSDISQRLLSLPYGENEIDNISSGNKNRLKKLEKELDASRNATSAVTVSIYEKYKSNALKLGLDEAESLSPEDIFTHDMSGWSGAVLHKRVTSLRLACLKSVIDKTQVHFPIIMDSPGSHELDKDNLQTLVSFLNEEFKGSQIFIASIYDLKSEFSGNLIDISDGILNSEQLGL